MERIAGARASPSRSAELERVGRLRRFFSPQLAELIVSGGADDPLKSHRREITVVYPRPARLHRVRRGRGARGSDGRAARVSRRSTGKLILEYEGTLEHFTGDGMMILFNDPVPIPNPAERAVRMALAIRERVGPHGASDWSKRGYELGSASASRRALPTIGAIGFEGRWDYGAIGTVTNLAARLCGEAASNQILISQKVCAAVEIVRRRRCRAGSAP